MININKNKYIIIKSVIIIYKIYKMNRNYIRENVTLFSIVLFIILFGSIQVAKPNFLYHKDGSIREFGIGYKNKTILPIWLLSIILGIFSYLAVMYYIAYPRIF